MSRPILLFGLIVGVAVTLCSCSGDKGTEPKPIPKTTVTDIDGNVYVTVTIGTQVWMTENLRVTHYRNGDDISNITSNAAWQNLTTGAYCEYNNDSSTVTTYGRYYNWFAVTDSRRIAPVGWRVPSDEDWQTLIEYLGGESVAGGKMKETGTAHWNAPNSNATNESGLTVRGVGHRNWDGMYIDQKSSAWFWSSTADNDTDAWYRSLYYDNGGVAHDNYLKLDGFTIRCIQGEAPTAPIVTTDSVSNTTQTTATCGGNVTADGGSTVTTRGVCWSTDVTPTIANDTTIDGSGTGSFSSTITGLSAGKLYYVRAYATNSAGTGYGNEQPFTTTAPSHLIVSSSFNTDHEGWTEFGEGVLFYVGSGGNPGGYIEFEDWEAGSGCFLAPDKFRGDLSAYSQGTLSFDLKNTVSNGNGALGDYGLIRITSGTLYAEKNAVPYGSYLTEWTTYSIPMTAETWGVTPAQWDSVLSNVTEVLIHMDPQGDFYDRSGLDNFCLTSPALRVQPTSNEVTQSNERPSVP